MNTDNYLVKTAKEFINEHTGAGICSLCRNIRPMHVSGCFVLRFEVAVRELDTRS